MWTAGFMVTERRTSIDVIKFVREVLKYCKDKAVIKTDKELGRDEY